MSATTLAPLGATDMYAYPCGVLAYYSPGFVHIHASADAGAITIPSHLHASIVAAVRACGLSRSDAVALADAVGRYAP